MRDALLPTAFAYAAFALATIHTRPRMVRIAGSLVLVIGLIGGSLGLLVSIDAAFTAIWIMVILLSATAIVGRRMSPVVIFGLAAVTGVVVGLLAGVSERPALALMAVPALALAIVGRWHGSKTVQMGARVAAGWLSAIALLSLAVPLTSTPGYEKDHMQ